MAQKSANLNLRIHPALKEALRVVAEKEHRSISNTIESLILERCRKFGVKVERKSEPIREGSTRPDDER